MISAPHTVFQITTGGTTIYCRRRGSGDPLLMIHGACTDSDFFSETAALLSSHYTVVTYDRRGYGRSSEVSTQDRSIAVQAADAAAVIQHIGAPCFVVGHSAGTTIAMELATTHPELVRRMILHEPVASDCLSPDDPKAEDLCAVAKYIEERRYGRAIDRFLPLIGEQDPRGRKLTPEEESRLMRNTLAFLKDEFEAVLQYQPQYEALHSCLIAVGIGEGSRGTHRWETAHILAKRIGCPIVYFPGAHNCAFDLPREFAYLIHGICSDLGNHA